MTNKTERIIITSSQDSTSEDEPRDFMVKLGKIMSDPQFKGFFKDYFNDWSDIKTAIMFMKTYAFIDEEYYKSTGHHMDPEELVEVLRKMMKDRDCRQLIVQNMDGYMNGKTKFLEYYRDVYPKLLLKN